MRSFFPVVVLTLGSVACATQVSQVRVAATGDSSTVRRVDALNVMPDAICKRLDACKRLNKDGKYATMDDCLAAERAKWAKVWSEEDCGGEHAALAGKVRECEQRASNWGCSGNVLDFGALLSECSAHDVCK